VCGAQHPSHDAYDNLFTPRGDVRLAAPRQICIPTTTLLTPLARS
jgi:hypothetical protein